MGFVRKLADNTVTGSVLGVGDIIDDLTGETASNAALSAAQIQANSAREAAALQVQGGKDASALLNPFANIGEQGLAQSNFLTDPNAQFEFLQNNPLFQNALSAGNQNVDRLMQSAAARGRLSAGDTAQQIQTLGQQNLLQAAAPLIQGQKNSIGDLLNFGSTTASNQGNLLTGQAAAAAGGITNAAAAQAAGLVGGANAQGQGSQNLLSAGLTGLSFSDPSLKESIKPLGKASGWNIYSWTWNKAAEKLGLIGDSSGVMADEVKAVKPEAVTTSNGYMMVNYSMIGL